MPYPTPSAAPFRFVLLALALSACGQAPTAFGPDAATGRANAAEMLGAFATRFTNVRRVGALERTHDQFVRHALFPSQLVNDSTLWSGPLTGPTRRLEVYGSRAGEQYHLNARTTSPHPARPGDVRVITTIARLAESVYRWEAVSELGLGTLTSAEFLDGLQASIAELESRGERDTRAAYRTALPRGTAALGTLFTLDSIRTLRRPDGTTAHTMVIGMSADRLRQSYPIFGKYIKKYVEPSSYHLLFTDHTGARWLDAKAGDRQLTIRLRTRNGELLPLEGAARPLPDSLRLRADFTANVLFFDVGMKGLEADVEIIRTTHEAGLMVRFRKEPDWQFPLATDRLLKTPLRRPFANEGAMFRLTVRDTVGAQTVISRQVRLTVQESGILRWLARLNRRAADDFSTAADVESNRFVSDVFGALRDDIRAQAAAPPRADGG